MLRAKHCLTDNTAEVIVPANGTSFTKEELEAKVGDFQLKVISESGEVICCSVDQAPEDVDENKNASILLGSPVYGDVVVGPAKLFKDVV